MRRIGWPVAFCLAFTAAAEAEESDRIPDLARAMLAVAYESGDAAEIKAVTKAVAAVFPDYAGAIESQSQARINAIAAPPPETAGESSGGGSLYSSAGVFAVRPWDGKIKASAAFASGNSENLAAGLLVDAAREDGNWVHNIDIFLDFGRSKGVLNQKRWGAAYQLDYKFNKRTYAYGRFAYEEDEFSGFDYRLFAGAGIGHFLSLDEAFKWKVEGGPGYRYSPIDATREIENEFALYGSSETDWILRDGVVMEQDFNITWTSPTTTVRSVSSLTTELTDSIATGISFEFRYETNPPAGRVQSDKIARASLVYGF